MRGRLDPDIWRPGGATPLAVWPGTVRCRPRGLPLNNDKFLLQISSTHSQEGSVARQLENGTYLLDEAERQGYALAVRMVERVDHRQLDLTQPLGAFDYLLVMCARLILIGEGDVDQLLTEIVHECLEERRRQSH